MNKLPSYLPYLYKWEHTSGKWYIGCKTSKGCHPRDHENYICSSKIAKPLIMENRTEWTYKILAVGEQRYIRELESLYLRALDAKNDPNSYNRSNSDGAWKKDRSGIKDSLETGFHRANTTKE